MKISRRKFLSIGGFSALALSVSSSLFKPRDKESAGFICHSSKTHFHPTWLQGNPHLGCSYPYFQQSEPTLENRWLNMVHFHMESDIRDSIIYDMPYKR